MPSIIKSEINKSQINKFGHYNIETRIMLLDMSNSTQIMSKSTIFFALDVKARAKHIDVSSISSVSKFSK